MKIDLSERLQSGRVVAVDGKRGFERLDRFRDTARIVVQMALQIGPALIVRRKQMCIGVGNFGGCDEVLCVISHRELAIGGAELRIARFVRDDTIERRARIGHGISHRWLERAHVGRRNR